jgi:ubiquinol-cytochrome c reductase cytochrome c1 subunit
MLKTAAVALATVLALAAPGAARAQQEAPPPPHQEWSFDGVFGTYNEAEVQRGFEVYQQVCSACHPVKHLYFRDLEQIGYTEDEVKGIAAKYTVTAGPNKDGQMFKRPAQPADPIPGPFANDEAARAANNGGLPPDLSLITLAREGGPDYVYAIVGLGFTKAPAGFEPIPGTYYNEYFPGNHIKMPPPLHAGAVEFDGKPATVPQMAHAIAAFLNWAAEPDLDERHAMGAKVVLFLVVAVIIFYAAKRRIWSRIPH